MFYSIDFLGRRLGFISNKWRVSFLLMLGTMLILGGGVLLSVNSGTPFSEMKIVILSYVMFFFLIAALQAADSKSARIVQVDEKSIIHSEVFSTSAIGLIIANGIVFLAILFSVFL